MCYSMRFYNSKFEHNLHVGNGLLQDLSDLNPRNVWPCFLPPGRPQSLITLYYLFVQSLPVKIENWAGYVYNSVKRSSD